MNTIIEGLRAYLRTCPLLADSKINVDYLPEDTKKSGVEYSIDSTPTEEIIQRYVGGSALCQYVFAIRSVNDYSPDVLQQLANSGLFEQLSAWFRRQTKNRIMPVMPNGMTARAVEAQSTAYLAAEFADTAKYQIQCRIVYYRKGER